MHIFSGKKKLRSAEKLFSNLFALLLDSTEFELFASVVYVRNMYVRDEFRQHYGQIWLLCTHPREIGPKLLSSLSSFFAGHVHCFESTRSICAMNLGSITVKYDSSAPCVNAGGFDFKFECADPAFIWTEKIRYVSLRNQGPKRRPLESQLEIRTEMLNLIK